MEFEGQVAVVTGAARGLGLAVASMLARRGASVCLFDLDKPELERVVAALRSQSMDVFAWPGDIAAEDDVAALRGELERRGGRLDILVNNAGGWRYGQLRDISLSDWDWTFRTNVTGPFVATRVLADLMIRRNYGRIVNVASADAHRAKPKLPHYAAAKAAVVSLTKSMAEELAPMQILVNAVSPGTMATERARQQPWFAERVKAIPLGHAAEPDDIAEIILFLASSRNRFMVGETVIASGGLLMV